MTVPRLELPELVLWANAGEDAWALAPTARASALHRRKRRRDRLDDIIDLVSAQPMPPSKALEGGNAAESSAAAVGDA